MKSIQKKLDINAHITNIEYKIVADGDISKALISFDNLGYGIIKAVKFNAKGSNIFGETVQINGKDTFSLVIQDVNIKENSRATELKAQLPCGDIRKLDVEECQICYADDSVSTYNGVDNIEFTIKQFDEQEEKEVLEAIKDELGDKIQYLPLEVESGWICGCGRYNRAESTVCSNCSNTKDDVFKIKDADHIATLINKHKIKEEERRELAKQEEIRKAKEKNKQKIKEVLWAVISITLAIILINATILASRTTYKSETEMREALRGTYISYFESGEVRSKIIISEDEDEILHNWPEVFFGNDYTQDLTVYEWNYKRGVVEAYDKIIVTKDGNLKFDGDIYYKY